MVISSNFHITRLDYLHLVGYFSSSHCEGKSKKVGHFPWLRWMTWLLVIYSISQFYPIYIYSAWITKKTSTGKQLLSHGHLGMISPNPNHHASDVTKWEHDQIRPADHYDISVCHPSYSLIHMFDARGSYNLQITLTWLLVSYSIYPIIPSIYIYKKNMIIPHVIPL